MTRSTGSLFPFDLRIAKDIDLPDFQSVFPNATEEKLTEFFEKYGVDHGELPLFKEIMVFTESVIQPKIRKVTARGLLDMTTGLLEAYSDQSTLEIIYENEQIRKRAEKDHDQLIASLSKLQSRCQMILDRRKRSRREVNYAHLAKGAQRFLLETGRPFHRHSMADSKKAVSAPDAQAPQGAIYFATDAIEALTGHHVGTGTAENALRANQDSLRWEEDILNELRRLDNQSED